VFADEQDKEYAEDEDGIIRSAENLRRLSNVRWAVISLGGNDVYLKRDVQARLASSLLPGMSNQRKEVAEEFGQRLRQIVKEIRNAAPDADFIMVIPYQPHEEMSLVYGAPVDGEGRRMPADPLGAISRAIEQENLPAVVTPMVSEILAIAREEGCPVIDLSRTLDPGCEEHYGTGQIGKVNKLGAPWSGVEPSDVSTHFIAELLVHAMSAGPKAAVYTGKPRRRKVGGWELSIKEEANDWVLSEDYVFGGSDTSDFKMKQEASALDSNQSLLVGVGITFLFYVFTLLAGDDPLDLKTTISEIQVESAPAAQAVSPVK